MDLYLDFLPSKNHLAKNTDTNVASTFLARLARNYTKFYTNQVLQEDYLAILSYKILARFFYLARKASFLVQDLQYMYKI